eukprot:TRINITY_DN6487_c1_g3_i1.p1 TRINITY_DN6487_c1_g3~~TRINITY_DN6487_c1_g3_i1.p1  ORF type:complete len:113 (+),score=11.77 TRINITY_DN6487_c1_g3_i1:453-791(+)
MLDVQEYRDRESCDVSDKGLIELGKYGCICWSKARYRSENCDVMAFSIDTIREIRGFELTEYDLIVIDTVDFLMYRKINREDTSILPTRTAVREISQSSEIFLLIHSTLEIW